MSTSGTIADMDMVLSINESAVNAQLLNLYDCPNPLNSDDYLISHNIKLGYILVKNHAGVMVASKEGLTGVIASPTVDFNAWNDNTKFKSFRIIFKFTEGTLTYFDGVEFFDQDVTGCTMSWMVNIGRRDIRNIEEEAMHPEVKKQIKDTVSSSDFLVSSLFCLFESTQVASTFQLTDNTGKPLDDDSKSGLINQVNMNWGSKDYQASNPFILGYQVSQTIPSPLPNQVPAFVPYDFILTTTPSPSVGVQPTLNFGIMSGLHREISNDLNAAVITNPFSVVTGATKSTEDGIFAFSRSLFFQNWLHPAIIDPFWIEPGSGFDNKNYVSTYTDSVTDKGTSYVRNKSFVTNKLDASYTPKIDDRREWYSGYQSLSVTLSSALSGSPQATIPADTARKITITVNGTCYLQLNVETKALGPAGVWASGGHYDATVTYNASFVLETEDAGRWKVTPSMNLPPVDKNGHVIAKEDSHVVGWAVVEDFLRNFRDTANHTMDRVLGVKFNKSWEDMLNSSINTCQTKIIMPAGDVFDFNGLDIDSSGNIYTHVKYKTILSGDKTGFLDGVYYIVNAATGTQWEDIGSGVINGCAITGNPKKTTTSQQWRVTPLATGSTSHTIQFMGSPKPAYASWTQSTVTTPYPTLQINSTPVHWMISAGTIAGAYFISPIVTTSDPLYGKVLDLARSSATPGSQIIIYPHNNPNTANQQWEFVPA